MWTPGESSLPEDYLYYRRGCNGIIALLTTYVDDLLLTVNDEEEIWRMVEHFLAEYDGRELGVPDNIVRINIQVTERGISLD